MPQRRNRTRSLFATTNLTYPFMPCTFVPCTRKNLRLLVTLHCNGKCFKIIVDFHPAHRQHITAGTVLSRLIYRIFNKQKYSMCLLQVSLLQHPGYCTVYIFQLY